jgi:hypothetical protein
MSDDILSLQTDFDNIIRHRVDLNCKRTLLEHKLDEIKTQYTELVKNNPKKIYLHCLDALFFQYKILRVEFEQYEKTITLIYNRMYGEYYKLYAIIQSQTKDEGVIALPIDKLPVYKDLELSIAYEMEDVISIHVAIIDLLRQLHELYTVKRAEIDRRNSTMCIGSSITGFIATLSHENKLLQQNISLFSEYLSFYHSSQRDYLTTLLSKINAFILEIDSEILVNHVSNAKPDLAQEEPNLEIASVIQEVVFVDEEMVINKEKEIIKEEEVIMKEDTLVIEEVVVEVEVKQDIVYKDKSEAKEVQTDIEIELDSNPEPEPKSEMQIEDKPEEITIHEHKAHKKPKRR